MISHNGLRPVVAIAFHPFKPSLHLPIHSLVGTLHFPLEPGRGVHEEGYLYKMIFLGNLSPPVATL